MARPREIHDFYFREAKREGYRSRAAYKLIELDDRRTLLHQGDRVLDCGCAPGSWIQVAAERVGSRGSVVGVDLKPISGAPISGVKAFPAHVTLLEGDLRTMPEADLLAGHRVFDVILSDMAPSTTGDRVIDHHGSIRLANAVLDRAPGLLASGGRVAVKVLEGEAYPEFLARLRDMFETVKGLKPKASRQESTEIYAVALGYRGRDDAGKADETPRPGGPVRGWG